MREIKFRGKRVNNGEWVYGYLSFIYVNGKNKNGFIHDKHARIYSPDTATSFDVLTKTVGQYTGLKDKSGTEIVEGDIIAPYYVSPMLDLTDDIDEYNIGTVDFINGMFVLSRRNQNPKPLDNWIMKEEGEYISNYGNLIKNRYDYAFFEVLGNIHDNPELLKVKY